jgi:hypothetical protein
MFKSPPNITGIFKNKRQVIMKIIDSHCHLDRVDLSAFGGSKKLNIYDYLDLAVILVHTVL